MEAKIFYSAPIPPASEFEKYESVLPGSADRILKMAEKQGSHRRSIETVVITFDSLKSLGGLIGALIIVVIAMFIGLYLIMHDKPIAGFAAMLTPLAVVAGAFIYVYYRISKWILPFEIFCVIYSIYTNWLLCMGM
jgi:uncharacterized membrane protein